VVTDHPEGNLDQEDKLVILKQVPIFASMKIGEENADKSNYKFKIFAEEPRNKDNAPNEHEKEILKRFESDPKLSEIVDKTDHTIAIYRPIKLSESQGCLTCHGHPSTSPWKNGKDILGYPMENWKDGYMHGVFGVIMDLDEQKKAMAAATWSIIYWASGLTLLALVLGFFLIKRQLKDLHDAAIALQSAGEQVASAANEISNSSQDLSASASQAAASIEETTASTEEVSSMIKLNASHSSEAKNLSQTAQVNAKHGQTEVQKLIKSMDEIQNSSQKIEEIISVIDDIAFQTNLLALNAAVEAARAGDQGKGFSVVAEAVRGLAQRSATSAKEITDLIKNSGHLIEEGVNIAQSSGKALNDIVASSEKVAALTTEIADASAEQSRGVTDINKAINELDKVTQNNAAAAEETAAASEELSAQSTQLHEIVGSLMEVIDGKSTHSPGASRGHGSGGGKSFDLGAPKSSGLQKYKKAA
jgi:methyl-accepting chemotaxis protein